ncbi:MAG: trypsin-like serine protease [Deltaproteobacteria bacterium]|nr:trypsin-like serine protease [Deltaproteobacteria bacterium]
MTSRSPLAALVALPIVLAAVGCTDTAQPAKSIGVPGSMQRPIYYGSLDTNSAHNAVVYIEMSGLGACTGTLITNNIVLTAGHCVSDEEGNFISSPSRYTVYFDTNTNGDPDTLRSVTEVHRHPQYDPDWGSGAPLNDIAVLKISSKPSSITPIPFLPSSLASGLTQGTSVEFVGYGVTEDGSSGVKLHVSDTLGGVCNSSSGCGGGIYAPWTIYYDQRPGGPCSGDSGGPAFYRTGGKEYVAGVTSYGDRTCAQFGCSAKVDHYESFIGQYAGTLKALGATCAAGAECASTLCADGVCCDGACAGVCHACALAHGASSNGHCTVLNATPCTDNNPCTVDDTCQSGACHGVNKDCGSTSGCTTGGTCNLTSGACEGGGARPNGSDCDDGNACTQGDKCQSGVCQPGTAANLCPAPSTCQLDSTCNPSTGQCAPFPPKVEGTECDDADPCTQGDACRNGACLASTRVSCPAPDACHVAGQCDSATGRCPTQFANVAEGTGCDDRNPCTANDACRAGVCVGTPSQSSCPEDACHAAGTCNVATGLCSGENKPDGTECDDGNAATSPDLCSQGVCRGIPSGSCEGRAEGAPCNDGNATTVNDHCTSGVCLGTPAGTGCGGQPDGTECNDNDPCTRIDFCVGGACTGSNLKPCHPVDQCHKEGTCDWQTGECVFPVQPNGSDCDPDEPGYVDGKCANGKCVGTPAGVTPPVVDGGCGCAATGAPAASAFWALGAMALLRRRRRWTLAG